MGSSFVSYQSKGYWSRDALLEGWLRFLADKVKVLPAADPWLQQMGEHWYLQSSVGFIGCVNPGLDDYLTDQDRLETVVALSRSVIEDLRRGELILTKEWLNAKSSGTGSSFLRDVPAALYVKEGLAFIALLRGRITTTSRTAPPGGPSEGDFAES
ncbi:MAG: hypothetical protein H7Z41_03030 [Cytophagales bacterium]|nr:hypothetical protein [Armatimonadota bacterium]